MQGKILNISVLAFLALFLVSCGNDLKEYYGRHGALTPTPFFMGKLPDGDDNYSQGFRDGCNTALSTVGTGMLSATYDDNYYDYEKSLNNNDYYKGRTIGFNYCTYYQDPNPF